MYICPNLMIDHARAVINTWAHDTTYLTLSYQTHVRTLPIRLLELTYNCSRVVMTWADNNPSRDNRSDLHALIYILFLALGLLNLYGRNEYLGTKPTAKWILLWTWIDQQHEGILREWGAINWRRRVLATRGLTDSTCVACALRCCHLWYLCALVVCVFRCSLLGYVVFQLNISILVFG